MFLIKTSHDSLSDDLIDRKKVDTGPIFVSPMNCVKSRFQLSISRATPLTSILLPFCLRMDLDCSIVPKLNDEPASALMDRDAVVHRYKAGTLVGSFVKHRQGWRGPLAYVSSSACASACFQGFGKGVLDADHGGRAGCDDVIDRGHAHGADGSAAEKTAFPPV